MGKGKYGGTFLLKPPRSLVSGSSKVFWLDRLFITEQCHFSNKAYRPNAHLLYIVMHYNGSII